jgi:hypothetical protein
MGNGRQKSTDTDDRQLADNRPKESADTDYQQIGRLSADTDYYRLIGTPLKYLLTIVQ